MNQSPIDVSQIDTSQLTAKTFPANRRYRIYMTRKAYDAICKHGQESLESGKEVGGVLIGNVYKDKQGTFLEVTGSIVGEHAKNEGTQVTFTFETWDHVNRVKDKDYPDEKIVGWYHTHPRFGVFLSEMDIFIQKSFFNHPWQTAFVLDPVQQTEGFFIWSQGEPRLIDEYWVEQERRDRSFAGNKDRRDEEDIPVQAERRGPGSAVSRASFALVVATGFLLLILLFGYVYLREVGHNETDKYLLNALEVQEANTQRSYLALESLRRNYNEASDKASAKEKETVAQIEQIRGSLLEVHQLALLLRRRINTQQSVLDRLTSKSGPEKESTGQQQPPAKPETEGKQ
ncbi:MAG: Mov34/MPN/PAD-1 family protein [Blastocatellia bacterium]|nr:Mov34/MPN/PAD-1 family protein [Blastocatellia bacterium]